jgi:pimeloyl-ACP methyl ester carboxylesterase
VVGAPSVVSAGGDGRGRRRGQRIAARRRGGRAGEVGERAGRGRRRPLREDDPARAPSRDADRSALVETDDGVLLAVEEIGPPDAPLTVVFVHGYTLSMASWAFQRRTLAAELATANGHRPDAGCLLRPPGPRASSRVRPSGPRSSSSRATSRPCWRPGCRRGPVVLGGHSMGGMTHHGAGLLRPDPVRHAASVGAALIATSAGTWPSWDFGMPELLTRLRAAVLPIAAFTMRRRPGLAERTRGWPPTSSPRSRGRCRSRRGTSTRRSAATSTR